MMGGWVWLTEDETDALDDLLIARGKNPVVRIPPRDALTPDEQHIIELEDERRRLTAEIERLTTTRKVTT